MDKNCPLAPSDLTGGGITKQPHLADQSCRSLQLATLAPPLPFSLSPEVVVGKFLQRVRLGAHLGLWRSQLQEPDDILPLVGGHGDQGLETEGQEAEVSSPLGAHGINVVEPGAFWTRAGETVAMGVHPVPYSDPGSH